MGFFSSLVSAAVNTALTPVAIVKDVASVAVGLDAENTKAHVENIVEDIKDAADDLADGEL